MNHDLSIGIDMTPMIDMVFQLLLFFLVITDFSARRIEELDLPVARSGVEDHGDEKDRIVINISAAPDPDIRVMGRKHDLRSLGEHLRRNGQEHFPEIDPKTGAPIEPRRGAKPVLIRCDAAQAFDWVAAVLQILSDPAVALTKVEIAASFPMNEGPGR
jgi:biopolymer transport protein ExbD